MAVMHPADTKKIVFPNKSEQQLYMKFREQLKDKVHVFYSLQWQTEEDGKSTMGEADFVIVDPDNGVLVLEVKGGFQIEHSQGIWRLWNTARAGDIRTLKESPYAQARKSMFDLVKYYQQTQNRELGCTYSCAAVFPFYNVPENISIERTEDNTIQYEDMASLQKKINHVFHASRKANNLMTKEEFDRIIEMLAGCSVSHPPIGAYYERSAEELRSVSASQDNILSLLYNYEQAIIAGAAGTGKTFMALTKVEEYAKQGLVTLYVCFNRLNAERIASYFAAKEIQADSLTFHQLVIKAMGYANYNKKYNLDKSLSWVYAELSKVHCPQYDAIIVDEAQDFAEEWALTLRTLFTKDEHKTKLYVFYDEDQNIFKRNFGEAFIIPYPPFLLRKNLRNTQQIWQWLSDETKLGTDSMANEAIGIVPEVYKAKNKLLAINWVEKKIHELFKNGIKPNDIVILSDVQQQNTFLSNAGDIAGAPLVDITAEEFYEGCLQFCTIQAYKGLEAPIVFCLLKGNDIDPKVAYVGYSRAKYLLYVVHY